MSKQILFFILTVLFISSQAQELNCRVIINSERIQTTERAVFQDMEVAFTDFMNGTKWTNDEFEDQEKINCNIVITLLPEGTDPVSGRYSASVQVLSSRPIYNSNYETVVLNFADRDWVFDYIQSQPIQYNNNAFVSNIASLLSYYAYIIIGYDYDTFSELGGQDHFQTAFQIVVNAQQSGFPGWDQFNSVRNRYWLAENLLNNQLEPVRKAYYSYHLKGLDLFSEKPDEARENILSSLKLVLNANQVRPRSISIISFMDSKSEEINKVYSEGDLTVRRNAYNIIINIDPTKRDQFKDMIN